VIGQGEKSPALTAHLELHRVLVRCLEKLAVHEGLTGQEIAARCMLTGRVPTSPAYSKEVCAAFQRLELEQTRGNPSKEHAQTA
jgi:hypothetical protein